MQGIKIRKDSLTGEDTLCYDYTIVHYAEYPESINSSESLSRIIAAIVIELGSNNDIDVTTK